jgi:hypothetical protein
LSFDAEDSLGYSAVARIGTDEVMLGNEGSSPPLDRQVIEIYPDQFPWIGHFGLSVQNESVTEGEIHQSLLGSLNSSGTIPSAYWAYTAGSPWTGTWASLTLGGYDRQRGLMDESLEVNFTQGGKTFQVSVEKIRLQSSSGADDTAAALPVTSVIDSVVPEIWLDSESCKAFERMYGLEWSTDYDMYFINDTQHTR